MQHTIQHTAFDVEKVRADFPILKVLVNNKPLIYFDNGATAQKPKQVIDAIAKYYYEENSNIHRGVHTLSQRATIHYELARTTVQKHINAADVNEIIFTRGTTESVNLVAHCFGKLFITKGDEIVVSEMEHHSNILPWQILCEEKGAVLKVIPVMENGELDLEAYKKLLSAKTKLIAVTHVSNTLGVVNDVKEIIAIAKQKNVPVFLDGAQAVPHMAVDVQDLDCDFYCFSGHKIYAPTGIGVLYAKAKWIEKFEPYQTGGGTIKTVSFEKTVYADGPLKFEAGTPNIEGAIGLAAALNYVNEIGLDIIAAYENELMEYATEKLKHLAGVKIYGDVKHKAAVISFNVNKIHPFDVGTILDKQGVAVRTGHHCTQPLMQHYNIPGTIRASFGFYNTKQEIDVFILALEKAIKMLS
ncbi:MAG TPA: cysteine desulfurase [Bacteroidia bacterium]|nr:cysteine desulfurase [Bacteroidia bacterium]